MARHPSPAKYVRNGQDELAAKAGCWFDKDAAQRVERFFERLLKHSKGEWAGKEFTLLPWQRTEIIGPLFGWMRADGTRRFRKAGIWVPKKSGKSTIASGISLYLWISDNEPGAEVYNAANDRAQAAIVFNEAKHMVEASPLLMRRIGRKNIVDSRKTLFDPKTKSTYQALSADVPTKEGLNIHGLIVDELHAHKKRELWDTLVYGGASRRQPLIVSISTAGVYDPTTIGWEQYEYARGVANGTIEDWAFLPVVYEAAQDDDWTAETTWKKANPSWGVTVKAASFREEAKEAQQAPAKQNSFRRYRLNQWVQQATRWIDLALWDANHAHAVTEEALAGRTCYGGLDLSSVSDISAWAMWFSCEDDDQAGDVLVRCWVPEAQLSKSLNRDLYQVWRDAGYLTVTPGSAIDQGFIRQQILQDAETFNLIDLNIDRLFQGNQLGMQLEDDGLTVVPMGQGFMGYAAPMKFFEARLLDKQIHHGGNPLLRWMADNVVVKQDAAGNLKIDKEKCRQKVDAIAALVMAMDRASRHLEDEGDSVYDHEGIYVL